MEASQNSLSLQQLITACKQVQRRMDSRVEASTHLNRGAVHSALGAEKEAIADYQCAFDFAKSVSLMHRRRKHCERVYHYAKAVSQRSA